MNQGMVGSSHYKMAAYGKMIICAWLQTPFKMVFWEIVISSMKMEVSGRSASQFFYLEKTDIAVHFKVFL